MTIIQQLDLFASDLGDMHGTIKGDDLTRAEKLAILFVITKLELEGITDADFDLILAERLQRKEAQNKLKHILCNISNIPLN